MKPILFLLCLMAFISCKKNKDVDNKFVSNTDTIAVKVPKAIDTVVGVYVGNIIQHNEEMNGGPDHLYQWDSTYSGKATITNIDDSSIRVTIDNYTIDCGRFKYTKASEQHTCGDPNRGGSWFYHFPANDSITIQVHYYGGWGFTYTSRNMFFSGKKH